MATTEEVGKDLIAMVAQGKTMEAVDKYYGSNIVSTEPMGENPVTTGFDAVKGKMDYFSSTFEIHKITTTGPYVCSDQFVAEYTLDATNKKTGKREDMHEMAVYTVQYDKIVDEKFFY